MNEVVCAFEFPLYFDSYFEVVYYLLLKGPSEVRLCQTFSFLTVEIVEAATVKVMVVECTF